MDRRLGRRAAVAGLAGLALLAACGPTGSAAVVQVNGEPITQAEVQREVDRLLAGEGSAGQASGRVAAVRAGVLEELVMVRLVRQQARQEGLTVSEREIDDAIAEMIDQQGGRERLLRIVDLNGFTGPRFRQAIQDSLLAERLAAKHVVTPAAAPVEERRVRHVLVASLDQARAVRARLSGGESWEKVAAEVSADPGSRERGGDLGFIGRGQTVPPFDQAAFSLPLNQLSEPVQSNFGYHILIATEARSTPPSPQQIAALRQREFTRYLQGLRQQARIEPPLPAPPAAPAAPPVAPKP